MPGAVQFTSGLDSLLWGGVKEMPAAAVKPLFSKISCILFFEGFVGVVAKPIDY